MRLKITKFGESAEGIQLTGNPKNQEPIHCRIAFPGGDVEVVRATEGDPNCDYWVHIRVNNKDAAMFVPGEDVEARIVDARLDQTDKHAADANIGDFGREQLYHLAVRVARK
jgi:hypothetical protein